MTTLSRPLPNRRTGGLLTALLRPAWLIIAAACATEPAAAPASIEISVAGLPAGVTASITLSGTGTSRSVADAEVVSSLAAGSYTILANRVSAGGVSFEPELASQMVTLTSGGQQRITVRYRQVTGALTITVSGLPAGANASLELVDAAGVARSVSPSTTIGDLTPASYTVRARSVIAARATWRPAVGQQVVVVSVAAPVPTLVTVQYAPAPPASLALVSAPSTIASGRSLSAPLIIEARDSDNVLVPSATSSLTVSVQSGALSVQSGGTAVLQDGQATFRDLVLGGAGAGGLRLTADGLPALTVPVTVAGASLTARIAGLPGAIADVLVTGPGGFSRVLTQTTTLDALPAGRYALSPRRVESGGVRYEAPVPAAADVLGGDVRVVDVRYDALATRLLLDADTDARTLTLGEELDIPVVLAIPPSLGVNVASLTVSIQWNTAVVQYVGFTSGPFGFAVANASSMPLSISAFAAIGASVPTVVGTIRVRAIARGSTRLEPTVRVAGSESGSVVPLLARGITLTVP